SFTNNGTIKSSGGNLTLSPTALTNTGSLINNGGTLTIAAVNTLTNSGTIALNAGTTNLGGPFTPAALASGYTRTAGSVVNLTGTLDLLGGTLDIGSAGLFKTGGLSGVNGGTIKNGTIVSGDATVLNGYSATLDTIATGGNLTFANGGYYYIKGGLTLANGSTLDTGNNTLYVQGSQSIVVAGGGTATLQRAG